MNTGVRLDKGQEKELTTLTQHNTVETFSEKISQFSAAITAGGHAERGEDARASYW